MNKKLLYVGCAAAMLATTACSSEDIVPASEQESLVSFSVQLPAELQARSRAYADGTNATKLCYAVYDATTHNELAALRDSTTFGTDLKATVNLRLANSRTYELVFWAQNPAAPYVVDYANQKVRINYNTVKANDNVYDAFYKFETVSVSGSINQPIYLTRPFAQVNIGATDATQATAAGWTTQQTEVTISKVYNTLNFANGTVEGDASVTYVMNTKPAGEAFPVVASPVIDYQAMVYALVDDDQELVDVEFTAQDDNTIVRNYANVPVRRNYQTNIYGNILTEQANFTVEIKPAFTGENNKQYVADGVELVDANTYEISNAAGLLWVADQVNNGRSRAAGEGFQGQTVRLGKDINLSGIDFPGIGHADNGFAFRGTFDGNGKTVSNVTISNNNMTGFFGNAIGATIKNLTLNNIHYTSNHWLGGILGWSTDADVTIDNCHVNKGVLTCSAEETASGWDNGDKVGGIVGLLGPRCVVKNCSVSELQITGYRDLGGIVGCNQGTVENCTVNANVDITVDNVHNYKNFTTPDKYNANSIVGREEGTTSGCRGEARNIILPARQATVATAVQLKEALLAAVATDGIGGVVTLTNDIVLADGERWTPLNFDGYNGTGQVVIEGQGFSISGLDAPLVGGGFAGNAGLTVKNLTLKNCHIVDDTNTLGLGCFLGTFDSVPLTKFINCHVVDCSIVSTGGARVGAFVGWTAGYNNPNDGPVDSYFYFENCSVENCSITASGSVGAFIGHAGNNPATYHYITNCTATDNTFNSTNAGGWRVGVMVGTAEAGEVRISGSIFSDNTLTQTGKTAPAAADPTDKRNLYGRFVPGTTGKLYIDGVQITQ